MWNWQKYSVGNLTGRTGQSDPAVVLLSTKSRYKPVPGIVFKKVQMPSDWYGATLRFP